MAKRVVMLTIPDHTEAEQFAREMVAAMDAQPPLDNVDMPRVPAGATIEAMVARPSVGCEHAGGIKGWTRVPRFGWFVCTECKRPTKAVVRNWMSNHLNGCVNLLHELFRDRPWPQPMWHDETEPVRILDMKTVTAYKRPKKIA